MKFADLAGKEVAILGMGREGRNVLRALRSRLPHQVVTLIDEGDFENSPLDQFQSDSSLRLIRGAMTPAHLAALDVLIKSPGVSLYRPDLQEAKESGLIITSLTNLWLAENTHSRTIVVTGTKGKSTTASLLAELLRTSGQRVLLRGNVGRPLFDQEEPEADADTIVIELSSYQLADLQEEVDFALLTNLAPEHLDWHLSVESYYRDKLHAACRAHVVFANGADGELVSRLQHREDCRWFGTQESLSWDHRGVILDERVLVKREAIALRGLHNVANVCAALSLALELGIDPEDGKQVISRFAPLPHRLEIVSQKDGRTFVNDSIASTPLATLAAVHCWTETPLALIVGGEDRGLPLEEFVGAILKAPACYQVELVGDFGLRFLKEYESQQKQESPGPIVHMNADLSQAVRRCWKYSRDPSVILLSPGAPSFDAFRDFAHRGEHFREIVSQLR